jgi:hypothetical protein
MECILFVWLETVDRLATREFTKSVKLGRITVPVVNLFFTSDLTTAASPSQSPFPCSAAKKLKV